MDETPDRESVIELLEKLGDTDDTEVLNAARLLHTQVTGSGLTWNDLLVPDEDAAPAEEPDDYDDSEDDSDEPVEASDVDAEPVATGDAAEDTKLIERLLARKDTSSELREELEGYKDDIKEGDFTTADRKYLQALHKRLSGMSKSKAKD